MSGVVTIIVQDVDCGCILSNSHQTLWHSCPKNGHSKVLCQLGMFIVNSRELKFYLPFLGLKCHPSDGRCVVPPTGGQPISIHDEYIKRKVKAEGGGSESEAGISPFSHIV